MTEPALDSLVSALRTILRRGLPIAPDTADERLLELRGVTARAVTPEDRLARVAALDKLLRQQLRRLPGGADRQTAAQSLFGVGGSSGQNLTSRRQSAASALDYEADHFRKRIEPKILSDLAWLLHQDSLTYVPRGRKQPPAEPSGDTPTIEPEDIADPERAEHEVLLSRIWSDVYGLRADLIERERWRGVEGEEARFQEAAGGALWFLARLLTNLDRYLERYGHRILHGEAEFNAEGLIRLAGWSGEVTEAQARELRYRLARVGEWERENFVASLKLQSDSLVPVQSGAAGF